MLLISRIPPHQVGDASSIVFTITSNRVEEKLSIGPAPVLERSPTHEIMGQLDKKIGLKITQTLGELPVNQPVLFQGAGHTNKAHAGRHSRGVLLHLDRIQTVAMAPVAEQPRPYCRGTSRDG